MGKLIPKIDDLDEQIHFLKDKNYQNLLKQIINSEKTYKRKGNW